MGTITDAHVPFITPQFRFQWEEVQNCHVILYPEGMVKLSASAGEILRRCDGLRNVGAIITDLEQQFPGADLGPDVRKFLEDAHAHGWIRTR
ncbi:MAG: pyrroloquinoline quinone biosynthesis peptide chaperone PqqD [Gammaproteobacteria bacterium]|nr:pyrroloquinoline quinone biosynthesis peptide chaperone PqqD [Gammaproteobacteria bacterium]